MNLLTRYIAFGFLKYWVLTLLALLMLVLLANFVAAWDRVLSDWQAVLGFLESTGRAVPGVVETLLPLTVLLAAMFTFSGYARSSELTAMKLAGMGQFRLIWPMLLVLIPVGAGAYYNQNYLFPRFSSADRAPPYRPGDSSPRPAGIGIFCNRRPSRSSRPGSGACSPVECRRPDLDPSRIFLDVVAAKLVAHGG